MTDRDRSRSPLRSSGPPEVPKSTLQARRRDAAPTFPPCPFKALPVPFNALPFVRLEPPPLPPPRLPPPDLAWASLPWADPHHPQVPARGVHPLVTFMPRGSGDTIPFHHSSTSLTLPWFRAHNISGTCAADGYVWPWRFPGNGQS